MQKLKFQRKTNPFSNPPINFHYQSRPPPPAPRWGGNGWAQLNGNFAEVTKVTSPLRGQEMHALTIAQGWGPSASRVSTIALGRPRRPAAALAARRGRPGGGRGALGCGGESRAAPRQVAGLNRRARAGAPREGPHPPRKRGRRPGPPHGAAPRARTAADRRGWWRKVGSKARPKLPFRDLAGPHLLESGDEHSLDSGDV